MKTSRLSIIAATLFVVFCCANNDHILIALLVLILGIILTIEE